MMQLLSNYAPMWPELTVVVGALAPKPLGVQI